MERTKRNDKFEGKRANISDPKVLELFIVTMFSNNFE